MSASLESPSFRRRAERATSTAVEWEEQLLLESLAATAETPEVRAQAMVELMALAIGRGDELAFARLRRELATGVLPPAIATLFRARVAWGLVAFGHAEAAERWLQRTKAPRSADLVEAWLVEFDRRVGLPIR